MHSIVYLSISYLLISDTLNIAHCKFDWRHVDVKYSVSQCFKFLSVYSFLSVFPLALSS